MVAESSVGLSIPGLGMDNTEYPSEEYIDDYSVEPDTQYRDTSGGGTPEQTKVVKNGSMQIETKNAEETYEEVKSIADTHKAFYEDSYLSASDYGEQAYLVVRVEANNFESLVEDLRKITSGEVAEVQVSKTDETKYYQDLQADLKSTEAELVAVEALLSKATTVDEILKIREQTKSLRQQANNLKSTIDNLDNQVSYSTLRVSLTAPGAIQTEENWWHNTLENFVVTLQITTAFIINLFAVMIPWLVMGFVGYFIFKGIRNFRKSRHKE